MMEFKSTVFAVGAISWSALDYLVGGLTASVDALAILIAIDMITGMATAIKTKTLCPKVCGEGLLSKVIILMAIVVGHMVDTGTGLNLVKNVIVGGYTLREGLSIMDNINKLGYPQLLPPFVVQALEGAAKAKNIDLGGVVKDDSK